MVAVVVVDGAKDAVTAVSDSPSGLFGGFRDSGSPFRKQGSEALRFYTRAKTVAVRAG